eukprot:6424162-Pyramimonas_sp.AAC.1
MDRAVLAHATGAPSATRRVRMSSLAVRLPPAHLPVTTVECYLHHSQLSGEAFPVPLPEEVYCGRQPEDAEKRWGESLVSQVLSGLNQYYHVPKHVLAKYFHAKGVLLEVRQRSRNIITHAAAEEADAEDPEAKVGLE